MESDTLGWTNGTFIDVASLKDTNLTLAEINAIVDATELLLSIVIPPTPPASGEAYNIYRQDQYTALLANDLPELEETYNVNISWFYQTVADGLLYSGVTFDISSQNIEGFTTFMELYRPPMIVPVTETVTDITRGEELLTGMSSEPTYAVIPPPTKETMEFLRSDVYYTETSTVTYNSGNREVQVYDDIAGTTSGFEAALESVSGFSGNSFNTANFLQGIYKLGRSHADEINSYMAQLGFDYDSARWVYDGPEQQVSATMAAASPVLQVNIILGISNVAKNSTLVTYPQIEAALQKQFTYGIELNFSALLTMITMFVKINIVSPNFIKKDYVEKIATQGYFIANFPEYIFSGVDVTQFNPNALADLGIPFTPPESEIGKVLGDLSRNELIAIAGIGVTLLSTVVIYNISSKKEMPLDALSDALSAIKTIVVDSAVATVVLVVFTEVAIIYSETGSIGGTIAQILADGIRLFIAVLEDIIDDLWSALKGQWGIFVAGISGVGVSVAAGEVTLGGEIGVGEAAEATGEVAEGAEVAAGEITEGAEDELGDVWEGLGEFF
jgi:hypothetical protein